MISVASSIKFRKSDGLLASFDNTMFEDESHFRIAKRQYYQKLFATDTITVQAEVDTDQTIALYKSEGTSKMGAVTWGDWTAMTGEALVFSGAAYDYWEVDIDFSTMTKTKVKFKVEILTGATVDETWLSEPVELVTDDGSYLQIEFFNLENAFRVYYVNPTPADRISHLIRLKGWLRKYKPAGDTSVYDNQDEVVKTKDEVKRMMTLETDAIPAYLAEMLVVAVAHDKFFVNEVEFVAEKKPEFDLGNGNLASLTCELTQRDVIGLNAHDVGFDCDSITDTDTMVLQEIDLAGQKSFTVPDGYLIAHITGHRTAGDPVVIAGTTPGGSDILLDMALNNTDNKFQTAIIGREIATSGDATLYVDVSGAGATASIYVLLLKNRQA